MRAISKEQLDKLIRAVRREPILAHACAAAKVSYSTIKRRRRDDPEFAAKLADAQAHGFRLEDTRLRRLALKPAPVKGRVNFVWQHRETKKVLDDVAYLTLPIEEQVLFTREILMGGPDPAMVRAYLDQRDKKLARLEPETKRPEEAEEADEGLESGLNLGVPGLAPSEDAFQKETADIRDRYGGSKPH